MCYSHAKALPKKERKDNESYAITTSFTVGKQKNVLRWEHSWVNGKFVSAGVHALLSGKLCRHLALERFEEYKKGKLQLQWVFFFLVPG